MASLNITQLTMIPTPQSVAELGDIFQSSFTKAATTSNVFLFALVPAIAYYTYSNSTVSSSPRKFLRNIPWKDGIPIFSYKDFHSNSESFIAEGLRKYGKIFAFQFMSHKVIAVSSEEGRKTFFSHKDLSFDAGWGAVKGQRLSQKDSENGEEPDWPVKVDMMPYVKRATILFKKERISFCLPLMIEDLSYYSNKWGTDASPPPPHRSMRDSIFTAKIEHISKLCKEMEQTQGFGLLFFPRLTHLSLYLPWLKHLTGGIIKDGDKLMRKTEIANELVAIFKDALWNGMRSERKEMVAKTLWMIRLNY